MRILVILPCQPFPPHDGQTHRLALVTRSLAENHEVALASFVEDGQDPELTAKDRAIFSDVRLARSEPHRPGLASTLLRRLSFEPADVHHFRSSAMAVHVADLKQKLDPELVLIGDPALTPYALPLQGRALAIDYVCEVTLQLERFAALSPPLERPLWNLRRAKYARFLKRIEPLFDVAFLNSSEDVDALAAFWPNAKLMHVANGLNLSEYPLGLAEPTPNRLIYPGSIAYPPNRDAVAWFGSEILPIIHKSIPEVELRVTGMKPNDGSAPELPGIVYTGRVPDVRTEIAAAWATIVPLRLGAGGARFKVIESMALGAPLVGTAIGVEGLEMVDGEDYLHAESPAAIADACLRLLKDRAYRDKIGAGGRRRMEESYDWRIHYRALEHRLLQTQSRAPAMVVG